MNNNKKENDNEYVKISDIYEIINYENGLYDEKNMYVDDKSKTRNLRNKFNYLMENVVMRSQAKQKKNNVVMIYKNDVPVIKELLFHATNINDENDKLIVDWFNGRLNTDDPLTSVFLYRRVQEIMQKLFFLENKIDEVTYDEWLRTISAAINYSTAENMAKLKYELNDFRDKTLCLDNDIDLGSIILNLENGSRAYAVVSDKPKFDLENKTIKENLEEVRNQNDYLYLIQQIVSMMNDHALNHALEKIKTLAMAKGLFDVNKADEAFEMKSFASEYVIWFQRIYEFLSSHPDKLKEVEEYAKTDGLLDYFKMDHRQ